LDLALQRFLKSARKSCFCGFNPCCIGFSVATTNQVKRGYTPTEFQSLLYWI